MSETNVETLSRAFNEATKPWSLSGVVSQILAVQQQAEDDDGELSPAACELLDKLNTTLEQKVQAYHLLCARLEGDSRACKELAKEFAERGKSRETHARKLRDRLQAELERLGTTKVKTATVTCWVQDSPPSVECEADDLIPDDYMVVTKKPDRARMLEALKAGKELAFAWLTHGTHLRFR